MKLTDGKTDEPVPEMNLVEAITHWAPGFRAIPVQRHVFMVPVRPGSSITRVLFAQDIWQN